MTLNKTKGSNYSKEKAKLGQGSNARSIRFHNERTILYLLRYFKTASRIDLTRYTNLTSQSLAMITNSLVKKRLIINVGKQINGIGQPSLLYSLNAKGVYSIGCNIGRKTLDMVLINFTGEICDRYFFEYDYPIIDRVVEKIKGFLSHCQNSLPREERNFAGLGIGIPNFLGSWKDELDKLDNQTDYQKWDHALFQEKLQEKMSYPVYFENDMNAATMAAMIRGNGNQLQNFIYLYLGTFIGGGVVLDRKIIKGERNNAGNLGTLLVTLPPSSPIYDPTYPRPTQLLSYASINHLKKFLNFKKVRLPSQNKNFFQLLDAYPVNTSPLLNKWLTVWLEEVALLIVQGILQTNSILDMPYVIFDSPLNIKIIKQLCRKINQGYSRYDLTGITLPQVIPGDLGIDARALGSAMIPIYEKYVLNEFNISGPIKSGLNMEENELSYKT